MTDNDHAPQRRSQPLVFAPPAGKAWADMTDDEIDAWAAQAHTAMTAVARRDH